MRTRHVLTALASIAAAFCVVPGGAATAEPLVTISTATTGPDGIARHTVSSPFQQGETAICVLLPKDFHREKKYVVLYLLPVEARDGERWGSALAEVQRHDLHNKRQLLCIYPTFSHLPWFADHPSDAHIQQEAYLLQVVLPFVEKTYPVVPGRKGRLLAGFSKSGWGALSLLLRHGDTFDKAACWDAPLMMEKPNNYGMGPIFGTQENFEKYQISALLERRAGRFAESPRIVLTGFDAFRSHHQQAHAMMDRLKIAHVYRDGPRRRHHWESGWLAEALKLMMEPQDE